MKLKTKKSLYICGYLSLMAIPMLLAAFDYYKSLNMHLTLLLNPLIFIIYDTLIMLFLFKRLKQEEYILQERVIRYFKILNFILFIFLFLAYPNFLSLLDIVLHVIVFFIIRPIPVPDRENGVEEFFNKYADFMESYDDSDIGALSDYLSFLQEYTEYMQKLDDLDNADLTDAESIYLTQATLRIDQQLLEVAG